MHDGKDKWLDDLFISMKGMSRAKPSPELFSKIENRISKLKDREIPVHSLKYAAVAASVIFVMNIMAMFYFNKNSAVSNEIELTVEYNDQLLISSYQIYK